MITQRRGPSGCTFVYEDGILLGNHYRENGILMACRVYQGGLEREVGSGAEAIAWLRANPTNQNRAPITTEISP
jgi:hypothetical protein